MPAVEIKESNPTRKEMSASEYTGCSLCAIQGISGMCDGTPYAQGILNRFEEHIAGKRIQGAYAGAYVKASIVTINNNYYGGESFKRTEKYLLEHGFKLLGTYPGAHGNYENYLYGRNFTLPKEGK
jgi:hypothetical protein